MLRKINAKRLSFYAVVTAALLAGAAASQAQQSNNKDDELQTITVTASQVRLPEEYAGGQVARGGRAGMLGNLDMMEMPFSSTNYTADLIIEQQAASVGDVLLNDPMVRVARGFGNFQELYVIRGFPTFSDDMTYNGIYGILPRQYVASELVERVEVFLGANAFLNGATPGNSGLGGIVNLVPKRAPKSPLNRITVGFADQSEGYIAVDWARRFGADAATGVRVNLVRRSGESPVDDQDPSLTAVSFGLDHDSDRFRWSADFGFQDHQIDAPRESITPAGAIPKAPDAKKNFAQPWATSNEKQTFGVVRGEFDINENFTAWLAAGFRSGDEGNVLILDTAQPNGDTGSFRFDNQRKDQIRSGDIGIRTEFETGPVKHRLTASASVVSFEFKNAFDFYFGFIASNLYNPVRAAIPTAAGGVFSGGVLSNPLVTEQIDTKSIALADTMSFADDKFLVILGARDQKIKNETFDFNTGVSNSKYSKSRVTPSLAAVYRPNEHWSIYGNYIEGLSRGEVAPLTSGGQPVINGGQILAPYQTKQFEAGVKYDRGELGLTAALFSIKKPFSILENRVFSSGGEQKHDGLELSAFGKLTENVTLLGGLSFIDAKLSRTQGGVNQGKEPIGVPNFQANFNVEWALAAVAGLTLDARAIYTADQFADGANTIKVPSWSRLDLGARYSSSIGDKKVTFRGRIENVTDESNWISVGGFPGANYLVLGDPRTYSLSISVDL